MSARKKKRRRRKPSVEPRPLSARIPLPAKGEKKHGDRKKYDRREQRRKLREEIEHSAR